MIPSPPSTKAGCILHTDRNTRKGELTDSIAVDDMSDGLSDPYITKGGEGMVEVDGKTINAGKLHERVSCSFKGLHR
jgi:hypothetical protein